MFKNILVPVDGSHYSANAAIKAVCIAKKYGSKVKLLHVVNHSQLYSLGPAQSMPVITNTMLEALNKGGQSILEDTLKAINPLTVMVEAELAWGTPANVILEKAREKPYDLIVMGSRGLGAMLSLLQGSVSERVVKLSTCPVMIVKDR